MEKSTQLFSLQVERQAISALIKHPDLFPEVDAAMSENDFCNDLNRTIFCVLRTILSKGEKPDKVIVAQKIKNLGINFKDDIDIFTYLDAVSSSQINADGGKKACQELVKLRVRREIAETAKSIERYVIENGNAHIDEIVSHCDRIYGDKLNSYSTELEPKDLFGNISDLIIERGKNPIKEIGLITPYPEFNRMFGGMRSGNGLYAVVSRPKHGKSTWLLNMAQAVTMLNTDTIALYLDTEMQTEVSQFRSVSANAGVPMWYVETGNWSQNRELREKIEAALPKFEKFKNKLYHLNVANRPVDQICSLIRRFYYKHVGRVSGRRLLVVYDYIKLTGENLGQNWAEHQAIGEKINRLNDIGNELDINMWAAMQLNRSAEDGRDDSAAISLSDRLQWFAAFVAIFRRKWPEEIGEDGIEFGTHKMIATATRFQGKDAAGHMDLVKVNFKKKEKPKYMTNFINFEVNDFHIEERGTLQMIVNKRKEKYELDEESDDGSGRI